MTIVVTGGGSGGHITPLLAVATELKKQQPDSRIVYIGQRGDKLKKVVSEHPAVDETHQILAGKFRRYHGEGLWQLLDVRTVLLNLRDVFFVGIGLLQALWLLARLKPSIVFIKGGFVGVPVGLSAACLRKPYVTHDSDAMAGLANRIISRWARMHAVALPKELYAYPKSKTVSVGVPIAEEYGYVGQQAKQAFRTSLGLQEAEQVLFITGGGLGAKIINESIVMIAPRLLEKYPGLYILHNTGTLQHKKIAEAYDTTLNMDFSSRVVVQDYVTDLYRYSGAADVVVARAGATNMAEMAMQGKACVIIPNPLLTGGHQLKNAKAYEQAKAVRIVEERTLRRHDTDDLFAAIAELLESPGKQKKLGDSLHAFAHKHSAQELAGLLLDVASSSHKERP